MTSWKSAAGGELAGDRGGSAKSRPSGHAPPARSRSSTVSKSGARSMGQRTRALVERGTRARPRGARNRTSRRSLALAGPCSRCSCRWRRLGLEGVAHQAQGRQQLRRRRVEVDAARRQQGGGGSRARRSGAGGAGPRREPGSRPRRPHAQELGDRAFVDSAVLAKIQRREVEAEGRREPPGSAEPTVAGRAAEPRLLEGVVQQVEIARYFALV